MPSLPSHGPRVLTIVAVGLILARAAVADDAIRAELTAREDEAIATVLASAPTIESAGIRGAGAWVMRLAGAQASADSRYHRDATVAARLAELIAALEQRLLPDNLFDVGAQLHSPPDSAFVLKTLALGQRMLVADADPATTGLRQQLRGLLLRLAEGVRQGGVQTANHRWAICAALAHVNAIHPDPRYTARIDEWLAEGLDLDADGQWSERSSNYNADVNNPAMLDLGVLLGRPQLLDAVRRNLAMTYYYMEAGGEMETVASRRQDQAQNSQRRISDYYVGYRYLAVQDRNPQFAALTHRIEREFAADLARDAGRLCSPLAYLRAFPEMNRPLPESAALEENFTKVFAESRLVRLRRGAVTATIFGGSDWHRGFGVGSGLSTNPAFFRFTKGSAVLDSVRLTPAFFNTGFFYPDSFRVIAPGDYELSQRVRVGYYQPLPADRRQADGAYALTPDGRFYSRMDFPRRPNQPLELSTRVRLTERGPGFELEIAVDGYDGVPVTLELCFRAGGELEGVTKPAPSPAGPTDGRSGPAMENDPDSFLLSAGRGAYVVGRDRIEFGPGAFSHQRLRMEGEHYGVYNGHRRAEGRRVYLTGTTPFRHRLTIQ